MLVGCFNKWSSKNLACKNKQRESLKPSRLFVFWWWKGSRALRVEERRQHERLFQVLFDHSQLQLWNWQSASPTRCVGTRHTRKIASQWEMICQLSCLGGSCCKHLKPRDACICMFRFFSEERERLKVLAILISNFFDDTLWYSSLPSQNHTESLGDTGFVASSLNLTAWDVASNGSSEHYGQVVGMWGCTVL